MLDLVQVRKISIEGQMYSYCTDNIRGLRVFEGQERFVRFLNIINKQ
jgi:hypothetical protein